MAAQYLLGLDIGSSFIKAALVDARTRQAVATAQSPAAELPILAPQPGWAEQEPRLWWEHCIAAVRQLESLSPGGLQRVIAVGIAYQMHGLVLLDAQLQPVRPAIIWCDSRAGQIGAEAERALGTAWCLEHLLNTPGNFTAVKLAWVRRYEPELFAQARHALLPGDYIAVQLTGEPATTDCGLSEMALWHATEGRLAHEVLDALALDAALLPPRVPVAGEQGKLTPQAAAQLGLPAGIPLAYRCGDQPNNALALGALDPGEAAATAGTSGVVFAVTDNPLADPRQRVNTFLHVNHSPQQPHYGVLLCLSGAACSYRWLRATLGLAQPPSYSVLNALAEQTPPGADGLCFLPFGNGAERMFGGRSLSAALQQLDFNLHGAGHVARAVQEGVAFALAYGLQALRELGLEFRLLRAAAGNMFLSDTFTRALSAAAQVELELRRTDGATGAALGAGFGAGLYPSWNDAVGHGSRALIVAAQQEREQYAAAYARWCGVLDAHLSQGA